MLMINYLFTVSLLVSDDRRQSRLSPGASSSTRRRVRLLLNHVAGITCLKGRGEGEFSRKGIRLQKSSSCLSRRSPDISGVQVLLERVGCEVRRTQPAVYRRSELRPANIRQPLLQYKRPFDRKGMERVYSITPFHTRIAAFMVASKCRTLHHVLRMNNAPDNNEKIARQREGKVVSYNVTSFFLRE